MEILWWMRERLSQPIVGSCVCKSCLRATDLLVLLLTPRQQHQLKTAGYFDVTTRAGHLYRIVAGGSFNIHRVDTLGSVFQSYERFCLESATLIPVADVLIAQKLLLEADEPMFLRLANRRAI